MDDPYVAYLLLGLWSKGWDLSESGKQKGGTLFFARNSDFEWHMAEPFTNETKVPKKSSFVRIWTQCFFFHWQMAQPFAVQNPNFEQKKGFTRFTHVFSFSSLRDSLTQDNLILFFLMITSKIMSEN